MLKYIDMIKRNTAYTVYIKVRYSENSYFMAGNQWGFTFIDDSSIDKLYTIVRSKLDNYFSFYDLIDEDIVYVQLIFRELNVKLLSEFILDSKDHNKSEILENKRSLNIPISVSEYSLGLPLNKTINNHIITNVDVVIKGNKVNFLDIIKDKAKLLRSNHTDNITSFDKDAKFYLVRYTVPFVLVINKKDNVSLEKIRYSLDGVIISRVMDYFDGDVVTRVSNGKNIIIRDNKILSMSQDIKLKSIEKPQKTNATFISNPI